MNIETYFAPGFSSIEEIEEAHGKIMDATYLSKIERCPRYHQVRNEENLQRSGPPSTKMVAGIVVHEALDYYYAAPPEERSEAQAIDILISEWKSWDINRALMEPNATHLTEGHLVQVLENYFDTWERQRIDVYKPISGLTLDDLDLSDVLAAKFKVTDQGYIVLGESSFIMNFDVPGTDEQLVLAGKPDMPAKKRDGRIYAVDHKTTSSYLSDWWAKSHEMSNKLRGYMAMLRSLSGQEMHGAVINGIYVGKHATNPNSKATRFQRFQFDFAPGHVDEAIKNQWAKKKLVEFYRNDLGYFPETCGFGGCNMPDICRRDPETRDEVKMTDYEDNPRSFWDL